MSQLQLYIFTINVTYSSQLPYLEIVTIFLSVTLQLQLFVSGIKLILNHHLKRCCKFLTPLRE